MTKMYNQPTKRFPKRLAEFIFTSINPRDIKDAQISSTGYLTVELSDGSKKVKKIPNNLNTNTLAQLERKIVFGKLILQGYVLRRIEGGFKCISGKNKTYHLQDETCECEDFSYNLGEKEPCKHLLFKDAFLELMQIFEMEE